MPSPSSALSSLRPDLAESFMAFDLEMDQQGYIANKVLPVVDVASQAGNFGKIPLAQLLQQRETRRAPGAGYSRGNFTFDPATYTCLEHGAEEPVDDRESQMYAEYFDSELISSARAYNAVLRNAEQRAADLIFNATTWTGSSLTTGITNEWDDLANATPLTDVEAAVRKVYDGSGLWANALVINKKVFRNLRRCAQVLDAIEASGAGYASNAKEMTVEMLAMVFDLDYIIVAGGSKNTAKEGQTAAVGQLWSDEYAMVCRVATGSDFREPCIGRTFHWAQDGSSIGGTFETYRDETKRSDIVRVRHDVDEIVLYTAAGHLLSNVTT